MKACRLCPRRCGADRSAARGACGAGAEIRLARAALHMWEEPCISGTRGSGAVFFSGCTLRCAYCQNYDISHRSQGVDISPERFCEILYELKAQGAHNLNLVTADQHLEAIVPILRREKDALALPIVYNCSGYESEEMLRLLDGIVDVYLVDFKYADNALGQRLSGVPDYADVAAAALGAMYRAVGACRFDSAGMMEKGVLIRHLVLPGFRKNSLAVLKTLSEILLIEEIRLSLMSQFTPNGVAKEPGRRLTHFEYESVASCAEKMGFLGYFQAFSSQNAAYTPPFDGKGVTK
ncbi:MAG: radical SAM protein [Clostridia bacterium]|nr:radical SAM protein [Clostridia bacterium]